MRRAAEESPRSSSLSHKPAMHRRGRRATLTTGPPQLSPRDAHDGPQVRRGLLRHPAPLHNLKCLPGAAGFRGNPAIPRHRRLLRRKGAQVSVHQSDHASPRQAVLWHSAYARPPSGDMVSLSMPGVRGAAGGAASPEGSAAVPLLEQVTPDSQHRGVGAVFSAQLVHRARQVYLHRPLGQCQLAGDLLVRPALCHQP